MLPSKSEKKLLSLRELHLTPHFIYLVEQAGFNSGTEYALEIWKDNTKIGVTTDLIKKDATIKRKHPALQFEKVRFVFDVEALFSEKSQASITLKLTEKNEQLQYQKAIDEFHLHILYYNFEFSKDKFVRHRQNSVGKISNYIFNYSFSAIYGERLDSLLFRKHEKKTGSVLLQDLYLTKKDSKYGLIVRDNNRKGLDTIFLIETVTERGISDVATSKVDVEDNPESTFKKNISSEVFLDEPEQDGLENVRKAARSILDDVAIEKDDSTITQSDLIEEIRLKSKNITTILLILISSYLIFYLMHPNKKI